jgi:predicted GNAT family acetyltransferase
MKTTYFVRPPNEIRIAVADLYCDERVGAFFISRINVPEELRGKGLASRLLEQITADSDDERVDLCLTILPSGSLDYNQLSSRRTRTADHSPGILTGGLRGRDPLARRQSPL